MSKKFNIREWVLSVKYWSLLFIPHIAICLIFLIYALVGASIIQEIESDDTRSATSSNPIGKNFDRERERLLSKIIDKRQTVDLQQYTKYVQKHIREFEEEIKKNVKSIGTQSTTSNVDEQLRWTFSGSLFFIGTTLTTIGSNDFTPMTTMGKLFLIIYAAIGIPLTLVFLSDLSLLITRWIKYFSLIVLRIYSSKTFRPMRQWIFFRFMEKQLNISIVTNHEEEELEYLRQHSPTIVNEDRANFSINHPIVRLRNLFNVLIETIEHIDDSIDLTVSQLIITLLIYLVIGAFLISSTSFFDGLYICFTSIFSINLHNFFRQTINNDQYRWRFLFLIAIYFLFGLAIVSLCVRAVQMQIQISLENLGQKVLRDLVEFLRQMGFHELSTDDILASTDLNSYPVLIPSADNLLSRPQRLSRVLSQNNIETAMRPVGVAEPHRRLSNALLIRSLKPPGAEAEKNTDKSVQVNTIIRSCGRCAGAAPSQAASALAVKKHATISSTPSPTNDFGSGGEDEETSLSLPPPNLDRLRQRRATLVAKTIINQMATQPSMTSAEEPLPQLLPLTAQRLRQGDSPPIALKYSAVKVKRNSPPESPVKKVAGPSQEEFLAISKQISQLLIPSDDEN